MKKTLAELNLAGRTFWQLNNERIYRVVTPQQVVPHPDGRSGLEYRFSVSERREKSGRVYRAGVSDTLSAIVDDDNACFLVATRLLYRILGTAEIDTGIGSNQLEMFLNFDEVDDLDVRYRILKYATRRYERLFEEPFTVLEFLAAIWLNPSEVYRQLLYFHQHRFLEFKADPRNFAPQLTWADALLLAITFETSYKSRMHEYVRLYEEGMESDSNRPQEAKGGDFRVSSETPSVFIVHGRDESRMNAVARFIEKLHLKAVILKEQPSGGDTVIEKLERHTGVSYGVIIMTPEDEGRLKRGGTMRPRARQNVVLEHGFLMGKLGRARVACLVVDNETLERPSDVSGVLYIPFDSQDAWKMELLKELRNAGLPVDANKAIE